MRSRHFVLLFVLVVLLVFFIYCLARKTNHTPAGYICAILAFATMIAAGWLLLFPRLSPVAPTGDYKVATCDCFYTDQVRIETYTNDGSHRELAVSFWYPEDCEQGGSCPLIVFSHGSLGVKSSNETLYNELASHGYVVCAMDHTYQCFRTENSKGKKISIDFGFMKEIMKVSPEKKPEESLLYYEKWMNIRMGDINLVLDTAIGKAQAQSDALPVYRLIDTSKIALIGHSLGGSSVLGIGRIRSDISAVIAFEAPFMYDIKKIEDGKFVFDNADYPVPIMNIYSDTGWEPMRKWDLYAQNCILLDSRRSDVQNTHISGTNHLGLTDFCMFSPFLGDLFSGSIAKNGPHKTLSQLNEVCLEFFDKHVRR